MGKNIAGKGHKEFRDRDEEEDCLTAIEPLGVESGVCAVTEGLDFLQWLTQKGIKGKGDDRDEEVDVRCAVLGTIFVEWISEWINECLQQILAAILRDNKSITQEKNPMMQTWPRM